MSQRHRSAMIPGCAVLAAALVIAPAQAGDHGFSVGVGGEYSTGDYGGSESIDETYIPVNFMFDSARITARVTVPYLAVRAPQGTITEGPDGEVVIGEGPVATESGLGDVIAALTVYDVLVLDGGDFAMDLGGKVKFGTASVDDGLGTGEEDYFLETSAFRFFERFTLLGLAGYAVRGDPAGVDLQDGFYGSLGGTWRTGESSRVGLFYDYRESSVEDSEAPQEVSATWFSLLGSVWGASAYVLIGIGDSSPDWGAGLALSSRF